MSTITGASSSGNPWAALNTHRSQMQAKMFTKVDADSSGSVDQTELQTMLADMTQKTGSTVSSTDSEKLFSQMDSNADGKLSSDELAQGMQSILPPPPSTMDFAQSRASESSQDSAGDDLFSKVDTDGDGSVSQAEMQTLMDKMSKNGSSSASSTSGTSGSTDKFAQLDTDGNGSLSKAEFEAGRPSGPHGAGGPPPGGMPPPGGTGGSSGTKADSSTSYDPLDTNQDGTVSLAERLAGSTQTKQQGSDLSQLARKVYDQVAGGLSQALISQSLSAVA
ncbi:MAG: EF-hand domain-containing protein [Rhodoferax sp.]